MLGNIEVLIAAPVFTVQLLLDGLFIGAVFALIAYGLALVWGVTNVKNLAQGDFVIMGGYIAWWMGTQGIHPLFGVPVAFVVMFCFGWLVYKSIITHVIGRDLFTSLLATFGLAIALQQGLNLMFGPETQTADAGFEILRAFDGFVTVPQVKLISLVLCAILATGLVIFMKRSRMGQAIRATAQNARAARVMGINTEEVYSFTFSLNAAICGAAGDLV
jgi:branched-chain amino acid transport system permease protein